MRRSGTGGATPTTYVTGYLYAGLGYTTVNEAAVPILSARHTHEELRDTPIVDKTSLVLMANHEILLDLIEADELEQARHVLAWNIWAAKAYGVKAVNPGGVEAWKWGKNAEGLHEPIPGYGKVTPAKIISTLASLVDELGLPHPLHLHCNKLGAPGNYAVTLETMKVLEGHRAHLAHLQYHAYGGDDWSTMRFRVGQDRRGLYRPHEPHDRRRGRVVRHHRDHHGRRPVATPAVQADRAQVGQHRRGERDGLRRRPLHLQGKESGQRRAVGGGAGTAAAHPGPLAHLPHHGPPQWCGLLALSGDHSAPDGRGVSPRTAQEAGARALRRILLPELDRQYSLDEIAIITSAGPARALGLPQKGHLGVGADADVTIFNDSKDVAQMFAYPRYVIKGGEVVVEEGEIRKTVEGQGFLVRPAYDEKVEDYIRPLFQKYYTMSFDNYPTELECIEHPNIRPCNQPTS